MVPVIVITPTHAPVAGAQDLAGELLAGRGFVTPVDVRAAAPSAMAHRLMTRSRRLAAGQQVVTEVLAEAAVPEG